MSLDSVFHEYEEENSDINLMPLIDIIFLLLIFFMLVSTFEKKTKIPIKKVKAGLSQVDLTKDIKIYIDETGQYIYQNKFYTKENLLSIVINLVKKNESKSKVLITPDKNSRIEPFILLLADFQKQGIHNIGIGTDRRK